MREEKKIEDQTTVAAETKVTNDVSWVEAKAAENKTLDEAETKAGARNNVRSWTIPVSDPIYTSPAPPKGEKGKKRFF